MDSGIYRITFPSNHYYIGKSENVPKRWQTHQRNFQQGKHTKKMQWAYNLYGEPKYEHILEIHPDHIDLYENLMIQECWFEGQAILNGTKPKPIPEHICEQLHRAYDIDINGTKLMHLSTLEHANIIIELHQQLVEAKQEIEKLELGNPLYQELQRLKQKLQQLKRLNWWDRLFKWYKYTSSI